MSKVLFVDTKTELTLAPGATVHGWWNNASPFNAVWDAQAVPFATGSTATGFNQDTSLEVTRVWRHFTVTEIKPNPQSQTVDTKGRPRFITRSRISAIRSRSSTLC